MTLSGFKSIRDEVSVELRPLTLLAGANSSGKSSAIQPLLLLKQTLESPSDPGPLLLDGDNVRFSRSDQIFSRGSEVMELAVQIEFGGEVRKSLLEPNPFPESVSLRFRRGTTTPVDLVRQVTGDVEVRPDSTHEELVRHFPDLPLLQYIAGLVEDASLQVVRDRCFLVVGPAITGITLGLSPFIKALTDVIHVPGLRGNPERQYPLRAVGNQFPGRFEDYTASLIQHWKDHKEESFRLKTLGEWLRQLGLTWKVISKRVDDTRVELKVGRTPTAARGGAQDLVNVADVGFGVSQVLPALVALLAARPGQLVYLEQPEIHLHPRAQHELAGVLVQAAETGTQVVAETHSAILLTGIQTEVARRTPAERRKLARQIKLHWFNRDREGWTRVESTDLAEDGSLGDWPVDFYDVELDAETAYLDAAERQVR